MKWIPLQQSAQIEEIIKQSEDKAVLIFKKSDRCYISKFALRNFESSFTNPTDSSCYIVDVVGDRLISIEIADHFKVHHESPQLIVVSKGVAAFNTSHENIDGQETDKIMLRL